jgi:hypothetical protein
VELYGDNFDGFNIVLSDKTFYRNNDTDQSKVSIDRAMMYLNDISEGL